MRYPTVTFVSTVLVSVLAVAQSGVIDDAPVHQVASYSFIDPIIKAILEGLRPHLTDLKIGAIRETISTPILNGTVIVDDIMIKGIDKFAIAVLKSEFLPLKLNNLTLTWSELSATAGYDIDVHLGPPPLKSPIRIFAKGDASLALNKLFFTIGAHIEMKNKAIQIKPKGLFGFDLSVESAKVSLSSLMGSSELGSTVSDFLSNVIPDLIRILKKPLFDVFQDDIIRIVNDFLKTNGKTFALDELQDSQELPSDSAADEIDSFFGQPLDLGIDLEDNQFNFNF